MDILRISFHRSTLKSHIRFFPNLEFLYKTASDPAGREEQAHCVVYMDDVPFVPPPSIFAPKSGFSALSVFGREGYGQTGMSKTNVCDQLRGQGLTNVWDACSVGRSSKGCSHNFSYIFRDLHACYLG